MEICSLFLFGRGTLFCPENLPFSDQKDFFLNKMTKFYGPCTLYVAMLKFLGHLFGLVVSYT